MATTRGFHVLVAADGSPSSADAVAVTLAFPWPPSARVYGVVAEGGLVPLEYPVPSEALDQALQKVAEDLRRRLSGRWPHAEVAVVRRAAVEAILAQARRVRSAAIVVGSRGHGAVRRLLVGSVSHAVVSRATCPILVVKSPPKTIERLVLGVDGSPNARRAVAFVARLRPKRGGAVTLVSVIEPVRLPSAALMPATVRARLAGELAATNTQREARARRQLAVAERPLKRAGWRVRSVLRTGAPLAELIDAARGVDVLVLGARGVGAVERVLLGSVAEGAISHARGPVLIVR